MKWFHHECNAKHDPALQVLGSRHGAAGLGIYWGLLEELGHHSDTFRLKVTELPAVAARGGSLRSQEPPPFPGVPRIPAGLLARNLFVSRQMLLAVIESAVAEGLFDVEMWTSGGVLYSSQFEQRADNYTRRQRRNAEPVRTEYVQCAESGRTEYAHGVNNVPPEQKRREKEENRTDKRAKVVDISTAPVDIFALKRDIRRRIAEWTEEHPGSLQWVPTDEDIGALLQGISSDDQTDLCNEASALLGRSISFHSLVLRAVELMLRTALKSRVTNPPGFIRATLRGNGDGRPPWVLADLSQNRACASR